MDTFDLSLAPPLPDIPSKAPDIPKSVGKAFGASLILPGLGQFYLRNYKAGLWLSIPFLAGLVTYARTSTLAHPLLVGTLLLQLPGLYAFGIVDAYYSAIEYNAGITPYLIGR